jgi:UDP-N-acetylglucosamine 2-epimerase
LVVTATRVHYIVARPVIEELARRNWQITVVHIEKIWEKVESFLMKRKKRSLTSFYVKAAHRPRERRMNLYAIKIMSGLASCTLAVLGKANILIIMSEGIMPNRIAVSAAKRSKIPVLLLLQLGMLGKNYECPTFLADKISVPGDFIKDLVLSCGVEERRIVVTGRPTYDALIHAEEKFDGTEICRKLKLDRSKKIVVYCTENLPPKDTRNIFYAVCRALKSFPDVQFVTKVHPSELSMSVYEEVARDVGVEPLITKGADIYEVLYICDLMITGFSTTALDAMILDKCVITINFTGLKDPIPFAESGAALGVYNEEDLTAAIKQGLYDASLKERLRRDRDMFVYEQTYLKDGKATERIVDLIEQMVA